ncbi:unnamed protein product [Rhizopus stolonifer]
MVSLKAVTLYLFRLSIIALSGLTLACHIAQIVLLLQIENTGNWWPDYIPYTLYYVGPLVSIISINALFIIGYRTQSLIGDRVLSLLNTALYVAIVVYNTKKSGTIPWLGDATTGFTSNIQGWVPYCSTYSYINTSLRCWLVNGTWLGCILIGLFWLLLFIYVFTTRNSDIFRQTDDYDTHDFKKDVPMVSRMTDSPLTYTGALSQQQEEENFITDSLTNRAELQKETPQTTIHS